jgi:histidinol-phosphate aminotransferase
VAYVFGHAESVEPIDRIRMHFEVNLLAQEAAIAALGDHEHVKHVLAETEAGRRNLESAVQQLAMRALPSATNFIAIDVGSHERAQALLNELALRGVFIRMPWAEPLNRCIRVTIGLREEQERFLEILSQALKDGF